MEEIKKSILASIFISIGSFVLLKVGTPLGAFLFALGLYAVCMLKANLFTGKCGFIFEDKKWGRLIIILIVNILSGFIIGKILSYADPTLTSLALEKVIAMNVSWSFFIKSVMCGAMMFIAVITFKEGSVCGILIGIPTFILCGFQHSIANAITMGIADRYDFGALGICILGNFLG